MDLSEALTITALGMGVVFVGLILTSLLIVAFSVVPRLLERRSAEATAMPAPDRQPAPTGEPVPPEVLTVIATVLEVERRLYHAGQRGRLTISRAADRSA